MDSLKILIADKNEDFREYLAEILRIRYTVRSCGEGREALALLHELKPDMLVLDPLLPGIDGLTLLEEAKSMENKPKVLMAVRQMTDYIRDAALEYGVSAIMIKTYPLMQFEANIRLIAQDILKHRSLEAGKKVTDILLRLGFQTNLDGYTQLLYAIPLFAADPTQPINKITFGKVAQRCGLNSWQSVDRSIRQAVKGAWLQGDRELWMKLFPNAAKAPSNKLFVSRIAEFVTHQSAE